MPEPARGISMGCLFWIAFAAFWIWMIVDCATNEPSEGNDKIVWLLIIILVPLLGPLIYFVFRRAKRKATVGR